MSIFNLFAKRPPSAGVARERLQILLSHDRAASGQPGLVATLQEEILEVIARHLQIDRDKVKVSLDDSGGVATLEIDIEMPSAVAARAA